MTQMSGPRVPWPRVLGDPQPRPMAVASPSRALSWCQILPPAKPSDSHSTLAAWRGALVGPPNCVLFPPSFPPWALIHPPAAAAAPTGLAVHWVPSASCCTEAGTTSPSPRVPTRDRRWKWLHPPQVHGVACPPGPPLILYNA